MSHFIKFLTPALLLAVCVSSSFALDVKSGAIRNKAIFGIEMADGMRKFYAKEAAVRSMSTQQYISNGFIVLELNIVTDGSGLLRVYHSRPLSAEELSQAVNNAAGAVGAPTAPQSYALPLGVTDVTSKAEDVYDALTDGTVIKDYPNATHAHTIEYRIRSRQELLELFEELEKHWLREDDEEGEEAAAAAGEARAETGRRSLGGTLFVLKN
ncbi:MAG: hypothetical protein HRT56_04815 [Coraliomargarita sp.]|nr:hypothetical protein [Coraliomargarita sp.]